MKSRIRQSIAKSASKNLITWEPITDDISIAHLSVLGKSAVESQLDSRLIYKLWTYNKTDHVWSCLFETLGGTSFEECGGSMTEVIEAANNYFKKFSKTS